MSGRQPCRHCGREILVRQVRGGQWIPFDVDMVVAEEALSETYVPLRFADGTALVPVGELAAQRLEGIRWLAQRHRCAEFYRWLAQQRDPESLGDAVTQLLESWLPPEDQAAKEAN